LESKDLVLYILRLAVVESSRLIILVDFQQIILDINGKQIIPFENYNFFWERNIIEFANRKSPFIDIG